MMPKYLELQRRKMNRFFDDMLTIENTEATKFIVTYARIIPDLINHDGVRMRRLTTEQQMQWVKSHNVPTYKIQLGENTFTFADKKVVDKNCPDPKQAEKRKAHEQFIIQNSQLTTHNS